MSPRRLIPYLLIFLALAGAYFGLTWRKEKQVAQEERAKKIFHLTETDISDLTLARGSEEVRLTKKDKIWYVSAPVDTKADQTVVNNMLTTLARLQKERDLGEEKDLKPFGLDKPPLVVKFTAAGKPQQLNIGAKVPGDENYYVGVDQDPRVFMISKGSKDSLDRQLLAVRDKSLLTFITSEVKGLKITSGKTVMNLEKAGPEDWRWVGRPDLKVRGDKVEKLLRDLQLAQAKSFVEPPPKNLKASGLVPRSMTEITLVSPAGDQSLFLGAKTGDSAYARKGASGPIVMVDGSLPDEVAKTVGSLEDRRLWDGNILKVYQVIWGPPGKTWTAKKEQESWQFSGPDQVAIKQPAARLEMAIFNFKKLEFKKILSKPGRGSAAYVVEFRDQEGKPLMHLEEIGAQGKTDLKVVTKIGDKITTALIPQETFRQWQAEMGRLVAAAQKTPPVPEKTEAPEGKQ